MVLSDFAPSITLSIMLQGLSFTHSGRFMRKVPDPGGPLMRTSIIEARPPQNSCALFVLYDFVVTKSLTPVDSILSMKIADSVDKTAQNPLLSMKTPDFVDKVAAVVGVSLAWFRRSKFRLHPFTNSLTRAVR